MTMIRFFRCSRADVAPHCSHSVRSLSFAPSHGRGDCLLKERLQPVALGDLIDFPRNSSFFDEREKFAFSLDRRFRRLQTEKRFFFFIDPAAVEPKTWAKIACRSTSKVDTVRGERRNDRLCKMAKENAWLLEKLSHICSFGSTECQEGDV